MNIARLPDFVIIGAQKSATTYLHRGLEVHPDVFMPESEIPFFEDPVYGTGDLRPLKELFREAPATALLGIKRPNYIGIPEAPARIGRDLPHAKLLAVLRNPAERALSAYFHFMRNGRIPVGDPNVGLARILAGKPANRVEGRLLGFGLYGKYLGEYLTMFPREQMFVILQEEFVASSADRFNDVYRFLGIAPRTELPIVPRRNTNVYDLRFVRVQYALNKMRTGGDDAYAHIARRPGIVGAILDQVLSRASRAVTFAYELKGGSVKPLLSQEIREALVKYYLTDIELTERLFGFDLSGWKRP